MTPDEPAVSLDPLATLRESDARWRAVVDCAVDAIIVIDRRGAVEAVNPATEQLFGFRADELVGRNVSMLMPAPYAVQHDEYLRRYLDSGERRIIGIGREVEARRKDGTTFPVHLSVGEMAVGGETRFIGIIRDLTERVALERQLREATALARVGQFASVFAHEVRNPLAAVSGALQMLSTRLALGASDKEVIGEILLRIDGLSSLIGDLLLYARPPRPTLRTVAVRDLVERLIAFLEADPGLAGPRIECEGQIPQVLADPEHLRIALQNLLINAAQARSPGGRVRVELSISPAGDLGQVDVVDDGTGIPEAVRESLFTPFVTTKARGTGLGLATVRRIAESHRGSIQVVATGPGGTRMRLSIPLAPAAETAD